jgi:glycosyltransferase involved in cell wall biosynthesis
VIETIVVVIPARDEEQLVEACLRSVSRAAEAVEVPVTIVLVADACTDATAAIAHSIPGVRVLKTSFANVGAARAAGVRIALSGSTGATWIANTDADSVVPPNWLHGQLEAASSGYELVIGTVRPRAADLTVNQQRAWYRTHDDGQSIGHVHGANLGILGSTYSAAGGFTDQREHEDVSLVSRAQAAGARILATGSLEVQTSGRLRGKTPGGYAAHLAAQLDLREQFSA